MRKHPMHTIREMFDSQLQVLTTVLTPSSMRQYQSRLNRFLSYLETVHPEIRRLSQLRRDPHILGWLRYLHEHQPPLAKSTRLDAIVFVRRLLDELAAEKCRRIKTGLIIREDCPILDRRLPKTLSPEDDRKLDRQLRETDNLCSNGRVLAARVCEPFSGAAARFSRPSELSILRMMRVRAVGSGSGSLRRRLANPGPIDGLLVIPGHPL
jgi:hypothetical protein